MGDVLVSVRGAAEVLGMAWATVARAAAACGVLPVRHMGPDGKFRKGMTAAQFDRVKAELAAREPGRPWDARQGGGDKSYPRPALVPVGSGGIMVPDFQAAEMVRRREKFRAAGCVFGGAS